MRDTTLYQYLLGLESPWTVSQVELNIENQGLTFGWNMPRGSSGLVRNVVRKGRCTTMEKSGSGGIWTAANSRPCFMHGHPESNALNTGCGKYDCPGQNPEPVSPCFSSVLLLKC